MFADVELMQLAANVGRHLLSPRRSLVTAESCTGGWIGKALTDVAGSSAWYMGGAVAYSNVLKRDVLGVDAALIAAHGAVSEAVARAMAEGAVRAFGADVSVAVTGIAGPDGGSANKPVGTVWFAWSGRDPTMATLTERRVFAGDREAVRRQTVAHALTRLLER